MSNVLPFLAPMTPREVYASATRGTIIATGLRDDPEHRFRFPDAIFVLAVRRGNVAAAHKARELAIGDFTMNEAMQFVRKVFRDHKEQKEAEYAS